MARALKEQIDNRRGDIPRSRYISRILEQFVCKKDTENQQNISSFQPRDSSASSLSSPQVYSDEGAANG